MVIARLRSDESCRFTQAESGLEAIRAALGPADEADEGRARRSARDDHPASARIQVFAEARARGGPRVPLLAGALVRLRACPAIDSLLRVLGADSEPGREAAAKALRIAGTPEARTAFEWVQQDDASATRRRDRRGCAER